MENENICQRQHWWSGSIKYQRSGRTPALHAAAGLVRAAMVSAEWKKVQTICLNWTEEQVSGDAWSPSAPHDPPDFSQLNRRLRRAL